MILLEILKVYCTKRHHPESTVMNTTEKKPAITIIGKGAIGSWIAHEFLNAGYTVSFVHRASHMPKQEQRYIWTIRENSFETSHEAPLIGKLSDGISQSWDNLIIIATRASDLPDVWQNHISALPPCESPDRAPLILVCCNGWVVEMIQNWAVLRPDLTFRLAIATVGIKHTSGHIFLRTDQAGTVWWGPITPSPKKNQSADKTGLPLAFEWDVDIIERSRQKWLFNTAANTLAGSLELPRNDMLLDIYRNRLRDLFDEAYDLGCELWTEWMLENKLKPARREELWQALCRLIRATGANENSMSRAVRTGEGKAEALYLGGLALDRIGYPELKKATRKILSSV
jgi:ketopantoate reductase